MWPVRRPRGAGRAAAQVSEKTGVEVVLRPITLPKRVACLEFSVALFAVVLIAVVLAKVVSAAAVSDWIRRPLLGCSNLFCDSKTPA